MHSRTRAPFILCALGAGFSTALVACWSVLGGDIGPELHSDASTPRGPDANEGGDTAPTDAAAPNDANADTGADPLDASADAFDASADVLDANACAPTADPFDANTAVISWNTDVPVCWMPLDADAPQDGWKGEKATIRRAVIETWQRFTNTRFIGWNDCPTTGTAQHVKIHLGNHKGAGGDSQADGMGMELLRPTIDPTCNADESDALGGGRHCSSVRFWLQADHSTPAVGAQSINYFAVRELGHVLGFADTPYPQICPGDSVIRGVDIDPTDHASSVMNYRGPATGNLTAGDIAGAQGIYGLPAYPPLQDNDRFFHDASGRVIHQDNAGNAYVVLAASGGFGASSSVATFAYPFSGLAAWFLDTLQPPHLRQVYAPTSGSPLVEDWGTAPSGCAWTGSPAVSSWGEGRADVYVDATCAGSVHLYHRARDGADYTWTEISPPGVTITSSPAAVAREPGVLDVVVMSNALIVHGSCTGNCNGVDGAAFGWDPPSATMNQGSSNNLWSGDPALAVPSPGVLRAFAVDTLGNIDFSQWSWRSPTWTASANWVSPTPKCAPSPAATRTSQSSLFVACTTTTGWLYGGWGDVAQAGTWWNMYNGISGGAGLSAH